MGVAGSIYGMAIIALHIAATAKICLPIEFIHTPTNASLGNPALSFLDIQGQLANSLDCDVRESSVCVFMPSRKTRFMVDWRLLVKERIANIGLPLEIFRCLPFLMHFSVLIFL